MALEFERILAARNFPTQIGDAVRVTKSNITMGRDAYRRMGYPETVAIYLSKDKTAVQLVVPGDFAVRSHPNTGTSSVSYRITSKVLRATLPLGEYAHTGDNVFVRQ